MRNVADRYAAAGYAAVAPAIFDRVERGVQLGYTPDDIARGVAIRAKTDWNAVIADIGAAVALLAGEGLKVGTVGFCWGGSVAYLSAARLPVAAAVGYYGGQIVPFLGETPKVPTMLHFGDRDGGIPMADVLTIARAQPEVEIHVYPAGHGFACDERKDFTPACAEQAWERTQAFFARHLA
ncbi:carboxymethylenebutenolidase [Allostella vacuolata]|nr:carboxymethylenebutenolidase [Stella vacuolata]